MRQELKVECEKELQRPKAKSMIAAEKQTDAFENLLRIKYKATEKEMQEVWDYLIEKDDIKCMW